jgi:hypothetical protein
MVSPYSQSMVKETVRLGDIVLVSFLLLQPEEREEVRGSRSKLEI